MHKKKVDTHKLAIIALGVHIAFCLGSSLLLQSDEYPVVWRYSMFMNVPHSLAIISLLLALISVVPLHIALKKTTKRQVNFNFGVYYIDFVAVFSLLFFFTQLGLIINGAYDKSMPSEHPAKIVNKAIKTSRHGTQEYLYIQDWSNPNNSVQVLVGDLRYQETEIGDYMQIETQKGFLGYEWIVNHREIMYSTQ